MLEGELLVVQRQFDGCPLRNVSCYCSPASPAFSKISVAFSSVVFPFQILEVITLSVPSVTAAACTLCLSVHSEY